jgi:hypothetical protein
MGLRAQMKFSSSHGLYSHHHFSLENVLSPSPTITEVWFKSLIRKTEYPTSLNYLNRLFLVPCWFRQWFGMMWQWIPHVRVPPHPTSPTHCITRCRSRPPSAPPHGRRPSPPRRTATRARWICRRGAAAQRIVVGSVGEGTMPSSTSSARYAVVP